MLRLDRSRATTSRPKEDVMATVERTRDHETIRRWAEDRGGIPTIAAETGLPRIDFVEPDADEENRSHEGAAWEDWFRAFDQSGATFLYSPDSTFFKLNRPGTGTPAPQQQDRPIRISEIKAKRTEGDPALVLVTREGDGWHVELDGEGMGPYPTKEDALVHAHDLASRNEPAELVIENVRAEVEETIRYGAPESGEGAKGRRSPQAPGSTPTG
jgi:hypothetical protein